MTQLVSSGHRLGHHRLLAGRAVQRPVLAACLALQACTPAASRPPVLVDLENRLAEADAVSKANAAAPSLVAHARQYLDLAVHAYVSGDVGRAEGYALLGAMSLQTALSSVEAHGDSGKDNGRTCQQQLMETEAELESAVLVNDALLTKLAHLQHRLDEGDGTPASAPHTQKTPAATEPSAGTNGDSATTPAEPVGNNDDAAQRVRAMLASVAAKIQMADSLDAAQVNAANLIAAKDLLVNADRAATTADYASALRLAAQADDAATRVVEAARDAGPDTTAPGKVNQELHAQLFGDAKSLRVGAVVKKRNAVVLTLGDLFRGRGSELPPGRDKKVLKIAELAAKYRDYAILVDGYTYSEGTEEENVALSARRAQAVAKLMAAHAGVNAGRIKAAGYGSSKAVADQATSEGRAKNRRIEITFFLRL